MNNRAKYCNQNHRVATYIDDSKISYQLVQAMDSTNQDTTYRVDMSFTKGTTSAKVYPHAERKEYHNYYLGHMNHASERTSILNTIIKANAYNNTDIIYTHSPSGFRHWIIARSGAPTTDFEMTFSGQSSLTIDGSGKLIIATTIGNITYTKAKAYSMNNTTGVLTLLTWQPSYAISGSAVSFTGFGSWSGTLVLEFGQLAGSAMPAPGANGNVEWSTYAGGNLNDYFRDAAASPAGESWYCGASKSLAFDGQIGQAINPLNSITNNDMVVANFDVDAVNQWYTYIGGESIDDAYGMAISDDEECYVTGVSWGSDFDFASNLFFDLSPQGGHNAVAIKLDGQGSIVWDGYIGGSGNDIGHSVVYNNNAGSEEVYFVGNVANANNFAPLVQGGGYQQTAVSATDGFIVKLVGEQESEIDWTTFFGGIAQDAIYECSMLNGNLIIAGNTASSTYSSTSCGAPTDGYFPKCFSGNWNNPWQTSQSDKNYFIASFDGASHELVWSTYVCPAASTQDEISLTTKEGSIVDDIYLGVIVSAANTSGVPAATFGNYNVTDLQGLSSQAYIMQWQMIQGQTTLKWTTPLTSAGQENIISVNANALTNLLIVGGRATIANPQANAQWCAVPAGGDWPICNAGGLNYVESDGISSGIIPNRSFIMVFDNNSDLRWSSEYGFGPSNGIYSVITSDEYIYAAGISEQAWTLWEYDTASDLDYYLAELGENDPSDATIARYNMQTTVGIEETNLVEITNKLLLFPNPAGSELWLSSMDALDTGTILSVYDAQGNLVKQQTLKSRAKLVNLNIDVLSAGYYTCVITGRVETYQPVSFIKQ